MKSSHSSVNISHFCIDKEILMKTQNWASSVRSCRFKICKSFYNCDLIAHFGCVNAVEFSHGAKDLLASGKYY